MRESEREREHGVLTVTPAFLVILKVGLEDEDKVGINDKDDASFCSFSEKCQNKSLVGQFGDLAIGSSLQKKKKKKKRLYPNIWHTKHKKSHFIICSKFYKICNIR